MVWALVSERGLPGSPYLFRTKRKGDLVTERTNTSSSTSTTTMQPSLVRRQLGGLVPPKIATPSILVKSLISCRRHLALNTKHSHRVKAKDWLHWLTFTPSCPRVQHPPLLLEGSRRDTSTARTLQESRFSPPSSVSSLLDIPLTIRVSFVLYLNQFSLLKPCRLLVHLSTSTYIPISQLIASPVSRAPQEPPSLIPRSSSSRNVVDVVYIRCALDYTKQRTLHSFSTIYARVNLPSLVFASVLLTRRANYTDNCSCSTQGIHLSAKSGPSSSSYVPPRMK